MLLKKIYQKIPYRYSVFFKNVYHKLLNTYMKAYYVFKYGNSDMFNDINIETTTYCNRRCEYCPNAIFERGLRQNEQLMPEKVFKKVIDDLKNIGFAGRISPHFYGEPLLDKRLANLLKYVHQTLPQAQLKIYTNADLLNINILESLYESGVRNYVITLHGTEKERANNRTRIEALKKEIQTKNWKIDIELSKINTDAHLSNRGGLMKVKNVTKDIPCLYSTNPLVVNFNGDVVLCCNDYLSQVTFGNVASNSLLDIWNKESFKKIRREIRKGSFKLEICKKCAGIE